MEESVQEYQDKVQLQWQNGVRRVICEMKLPLDISNG